MSDVNSVTRTVPAATRNMLLQLSRRCFHASALAPFDKTDVSHQISAHKFHAELFYADNRKVNFSCNRMDALPKLLVGQLRIQR